MLSADRLPCVKTGRLPGGPSPFLGVPHAAVEALWTDPRLCGQKRRARAAMWEVSRSRLILRPFPSGSHHRAGTTAWPHSTLSTTHRCGGFPLLPRASRDGMCDTQRFGRTCPRTSTQLPSGFLHRRGARRRGAAGSVHDFHGRSRRSSKVLRSRHPSTTAVEIRCLAHRFMGPDGIAPNFVRQWR